MMVTRAYSNYTNPIGSVVCTEFNHLIIKTLKPAEDGNGIIVRMYEPLGVHCEDILHSRIPFTRMFKCNMLEKVEAELDTTSPVMARPFEIITLRLQK
jgi:alpha-mannosidase